LFRNRHPSLLKLSSQHCSNASTLDIYRTVSSCLVLHDNQQTSSWRAPRARATRSSVVTLSQPSRSVKKSPVAHFAVHHLIFGINFLSYSTNLIQNTLLMMSHLQIHLPPAHHSHPPSHIHCFIPGSKLTFSTNRFHHSLLAPT